MINRGNAVVEGEKSCTFIPSSRRYSNSPRGLQGGLYGRFRACTLLSLMPVASPTTFIKATAEESPVKIENQAEKLNAGPELIARAQEGDPQAFAALFEMHKPRIYAICLRMTNNMAEAEDLTQDAFIHVFRKLSTFRGESAFSTWLYRIAVNTVLMHFRKKSNRQVSLDQPSQNDSTVPKREYGRVDDRLAGSVDRLALARAINELPPGYRTIFLMHEVQGYEHQEIARLLHCSIGNSKSQLHKAKLRMRRLLAPDMQNLNDELLSDNLSEVLTTGPKNKEVRSQKRASNRLDDYSVREQAARSRKLERIPIGIPLNAINDASLAMGSAS
jgi:RNA polymerase sigma-70 factor, ECF subfamily